MNMNTSPRKHSRASKSSKRSIRSSLLGSAESRKSDASLISAERKLERILENEEHELIVYAIRNELIERVLDECEQKYLEKQAVSFVTQCSYRALKQIVELGHFMHDPGKPYYEHHPNWTPDKPPQPSPSDSWAAHTVPIRPISPPILSDYKIEDNITLASCESKDATRMSEDFEFGEVTLDPSLEVLYQGRITPDSYLSVVHDELHLPSLLRALAKSGEIKSDTDAETVPEAETESEIEAKQADANIETLSIFTRTTRVPKEDLLPSSICPAPVKKVPKRITEEEEEEITEEEEEPDDGWREASSPPRMSIKGLPPLRTDVIYTKFKGSKGETPEKVESKEPPNGKKP